ncbi:hypothetical protein BDN72DRAFT_59079 [Pluteus cervinus]|uniref:Uncharacterized protein n=1 Tax=Pluteus cervinus TaxID=181527 RepID=A0ACD3AR81_9AGAR|nr:hypothetical protein BDN72DRAFT_59079 [Pluteus cervinus]
MRDFVSSCTFGDVQTNLIGSSQKLSQGGSDGEPKDGPMASAEVVMGAQQRINKSPRPRPLYYNCGTFLKKNDIEKTTSSYVCDQGLIWYLDGVPPSYISFFVSSDAIDFCRTHNMKVISPLRFHQFNWPSKSFASPRRSPSSTQIDSARVPWNVGKAKRYANCRCGRSENTSSERTIHASNCGPRCNRR